MLANLLREMGKELAHIPSYLKGLYYVLQLNRPIITVFGGRETNQDSRYFKDAYALGRKLVEHNHSVMTGGGPGIMEAALCGALSVTDGKHALGIGVQGIDADYIPICKPRLIFVGDFADRKELLINYSTGFVFFPGGYGTFDELSTVLNLMKVKKIKELPIILFGTSYWNPLFEWFNAFPVKEQYIPRHVQNIITITDSIEECIHLLK